MLYSYIFNLGWVLLNSTNQIIEIRIKFPEDSEEDFEEDFSSNDDEENSGAEDFGSLINASTEKTKKTTMDNLRQLWSLDEYALKPWPWVIICYCMDMVIVQVTRPRDKNGPDGDLSSVVLVFLYSCIIQYSGLHFCLQYVIQILLYG